MAVRARLTPPPPEEPGWRWHEAKWTSLPVSALSSGERRLEAENYLASGFGLRTSAESRAFGRTTIGRLARIWQPSRLKGIQVAPEFGTPFLAATQVFDLRPMPRKWLALARTHDASNRFVSNGTIVVTCSGNVGRATLAQEYHAKILISHDLLRVEPHDPKQWGWLYGLFRAENVRAMMTASRYGHIIKHLEPSHLASLPIPNVNETIQREFDSRARTVLEKRNAAHRLTLEAEQRYESNFGAVEFAGTENGFAVRASATVFGTRRRLEASVYNPRVNQVRSLLRAKARSFTAISEAGYDVWVPGRYKRIPAEDGVVYRDSADLLEVSPDLSKRFADCRFGDEFGGRVKGGWVLVPSSGQVYGIIGSAVLATQALDDQVISNHVIRIAPRENARMQAGYLVAAMSHPVLGRPLVKSLAFGSSVPEIDGDDLAAMEVPRLPNHEERAIADVMERAAEARAEADIAEQQMGAAAGKLFERFLEGDTSFLAPC